MCLKRNIRSEVMQLIPHTTGAKIKSSFLDDSARTHRKQLLGYNGESLLSLNISFQHKILHSPLMPALPYATNRSNHRTGVSCFRFAATSCNSHIAHLKDAEGSYMKQQCGTNLDTRIPEFISQQKRLTARFTLLSHIVWNIGLHIYIYYKFVIQWCYRHLWPRVKERTSGFPLSGGVQWDSHSPQHSAGCLPVQVSV